MNNNASLQSYTQELNQGITFCLGRTTQHELAVNHTYRIKRFDGSSTGSNDELNEYFLQTGVFHHRIYKPSDAPSMDDYFGTFEGEGTNWSVPEAPEIPKATTEYTHLYEEPCCDCHLPIGMYQHITPNSEGYSQKKKFIRCPAAKVCSEYNTLVQMINDAVKEQNPTIYYAARGCADESGNYDEEYGEDCYVFIFPTEVIVYWCESYMHFGPVHPTKPSIHTVNPNWASALSYWL